MVNEKDINIEEAAEKDLDTDKKKKPSKKTDKEKDELKAKVKELEDALKDSDDKYLRMLAEYDNYKKRTQKEKESIYTDATCDSVEKLLTVLDNLERAAAVDVSMSDAKSVVDGVNKILEQAKEVFSKMGVEEIASLGEKFNPEYHNAVMHDDSDEYDENTISDVFLKGYKLGEKVIRHSMVKVMN